MFTHARITNAISTPVEIEIQIDTRGLCGLSLSADCSHFCLNGEDQHFLLLQSKSSFISTLLFKWPEALHSRVTTAGMTYCKWLHVMYLTHLTYSMATY